MKSRWEKMKRKYKVKHIYKHTSINQKIAKSTKKKMPEKIAIQHPFVLGNIYGDKNKTKSKYHGNTKNNNFAMSFKAFFT